MQLQKYVAHTLSAKVMTLFSHARRASAYQYRLHGSAAPMLAIDTPSYYHLLLDDYFGRLSRQYSRLFI